MIFMNEEEPKRIDKEFETRVKNQILTDMRKESIVNFGIDVLIIVLIGISFAGLILNKG